MFNKVNAEASGNRFDYEIARLVQKLYVSVWFILLLSPVMLRDNI